MSDTATFRTNRAPAFDEVALLRREVEARFGRRGLTHSESASSRPSAESTTASSTTISRMPETTVGGLYIVESQAASPICGGDTKGNTASVVHRGANR